MDAHQHGIGDGSAYQEIQPEQLRRAAPEAPVHAHRASGGDVRPVSTVPRDADEVYRSLPRTPPQETFAKVAHVPSATTGAVAFDEMRTQLVLEGEEARHLARERF